MKLKIEAKNGLQAGYILDVLNKYTNCVKDFKMVGISEEDCRVIVDINIDDDVISECLKRETLLKFSKK
jgi:hypothetical protein